ncbi:MAG: ABC transporter permease [Aggregatilineales bacterium]
MIFQSLRRFLTGVFACIGFLFLILPIMGLLERSLVRQAWAALDTTLISDAITLSFFTTGVTLLLTLIFGTSLAYILTRWRFPGRNIMNALIELPIVLPPAVAGLALLLTLGRRTPLGMLLEQWDIILPFSLAAVVLAQCFVAAPFYIRAAIVGFQGVSREIEDAARVDGADETTLFFRVTLPLAAPSLGAGLVLCWARALGEFGATILFAGSLPGRTQTMPLLIYNILERDIDTAISTGLLLIGLALVALLLSQWLRMRAEQQSST